MEACVVEIKALCNKCQAVTTLHVVSAIKQFTHTHIHTLYTHLQVTWYVVVRAYCMEDARYGKINVTGLTDWKWPVGISSMQRMMMSDSTADGRYLKSRNNQDPLKNDKSTSWCNFKKCLLNRHFFSHGKLRGIYIAAWDWRAGWHEAGIKIIHNGGYFWQRCDLNSNIVLYKVRFICFILASFTHTP